MGNALSSSSTIVEGLRAELLAEREAHRRTREELEHTEAALGRFLPRQFLTMLGKRHITEVGLGDAIERKLTVVFVDIRDFTPLCEGMTPDETFRFVNAFIGALEPEIERHGGFVDKYIGDAIMALFPRSAADAIAGAQAMLGALARFDAERVRSGLTSVRVGIGMHTGIVSLGTVGDATRLETTVLGDTVNVASRVEELTKVYGVPLLASGGAIYALGEAPGPTVRFVDRVRVKGRTQPQSIYELFETDPPDLRVAKAATRPTFEEAVAWYHHRAIDRALPLFEACQSEAPQDQPTRLYLERCRAYLAEGRFDGTGEVDGTTAWREEFTVGYGPIDAQHRQLLAAFNRLAAALKQGDASGVQSILAFADAYAAEHFGLEEGLMRVHGYPFILEHEREHRAFVEHFRRLREQIESGRHELPFLVFLAQIVLIDWFANHSTGTDRHLARFLRSIEGASPS